MRRTKSWDLTYPGGRAKIQKNLALLQETVLLIQLHQLKRRSCSVSLFLCQVIPLIQTTFSVLLESQYGTRKKNSYSELNIAHLLLHRHFEMWEVERLDKYPYSKNDNSYQRLEVQSRAKRRDCLSCFHQEEETSRLIFFFCRWRCVICPATFSLRHQGGQRKACDMISGCRA